MMHRFLQLLLAAALLAHASAGRSADVVVGQVTPLTGPEARQGMAYAAGLKLALEAANRGTHNPARHTFKLVAVDDRGAPEESLQQTSRLIAQSRPLVLTGHVGGPSLSALLKSGLLDRNELLMVGYRSAQILPSSQRLFAIKAGMPEELGKLMTHIHTVGWKRVVLLYENEGGAEGLLAAADAAAQQAQVTLVDRLEIDKGSLDAKVDRVLRAKPQALVVAAGGFVAGASSACGWPAPRRRSSRCPTPTWSSWRCGWATTTCAGW